MRFHQIKGGKEQVKEHRKDIVFNTALQMNRSPSPVSVLTLEQQQERLAHHGMLSMAGVMV